MGLFISCLLRPLVAAFFISRIGVNVLLILVIVLHLGGFVAGLGMLNGNVNKDFDMAVLKVDTSCFARKGRENRPLHPHERARFYVRIFICSQVFSASIFWIVFG